MENDRMLLFSVLSFDTRSSLVVVVVVVVVVMVVKKWGQSDMSW
jgi:hypothetical protein